MYNVEETGKFDLLPDGDYEATLTSAKKKLSRSGTEYLELTFEIRKDVQQQGKGRLIFDNIFKDRENPEYFDRQKLGCIISTQPNHPKNFKSEDLAIQYINGIKLIIKVSHTDGSDGYDPKNIIKGKFGFRPSKFTGPAEAPQAPSAASDGIEDFDCEIEDEEGNPLF